MTSQRGRHTLIGFVIAAALFAAACEQKSISQIKAEPDRYSNKEVAVVGQVTQSVSVLGRGAYEVDDGTGRLWIVSQAGVPRKGSRVMVKGTIRDAFNLEAIVRLPQPIGSVLVMMESEHRAR